MPGSRFSFSGIAEIAILRLAVAVLREDDHCVEDQMPFYAPRTKIERAAIHPQPAGFHFRSIGQRIRLDLAVIAVGEHFGPDSVWAGNALPCKVFHRCL